MKLKTFFSLKRFFLAWLIVYAIATIVDIWSSMPGHFNLQNYIGKGPPSSQQEWLCPTWQGGRLCSSTDFLQLLVAGAPVRIFFAFWSALMWLYFVLIYIALTVINLVRERGAIDL